MYQLAAPCYDASLTPVLTCITLTHKHTLPALKELPELSSAGACTAAICQHGWLEYLERLMYDSIIQSSTMEHKTQTCDECCLSGCRQTMCAHHGMQCGWPQRR